MAQSSRGTERRITQELKSLEDSPIDGASIMDGDDLFNLEVTLDGPEDTVYEGGVFDVKVIIPIEYPFRPPVVTFSTPIYHPNIKSSGEEAGKMCADLISNGWAPTCNIRYVIETVIQILKEPNPESALEPEIAQLFITNREGFDQKAREMVNASMDDDE